MLTFKSKLMKHVSISVIILLFLNSCEKVARAAITPDRCKKCAVIDDNTNDTLSTYEGCGAGFVDVEDDAELFAYSCIKSTNNCNISVSCTTWKKEED